MSLAILRRQEVHRALHTCVGLVWIVTQDKLSNLSADNLSSGTKPLGGSLAQAFRLSGPVGPMSHNSQTRTGLGTGISSSFVEHGGADSCPANP